MKYQRMKRTKGMKQTKWKKQAKKTNKTDEMKLKISIL